MVYLFNLLYFGVLRIKTLTYMLLHFCRVHILKVCLKKKSAEMRLIYKRILSEMYQIQQG